MACTVIIISRPYTTIRRPWPTTEWNLQQKHTYQVDWNGQYLTWERERGTEIDTYVHWNELVLLWNKKNMIDNYEQTCQSHGLTIRDQYLKVWETAEVSREITRFLSSEGRSGYDYFCCVESKMWLFIGKQNCCVKTIIGILDVVYWWSDHPHSLPR